jgi:hypothetical protein
MNKASKAILGGIIGVMGAGAAQAGTVAPPIVGGLLPSDYDLNTVCPPDGSDTFEGTDGCVYEVSWRCDGTALELGDDGYSDGMYGFYGVCIGGSFAGLGGPAASWAWTSINQDDAAPCEDLQYGFYGFLTGGALGAGPEGAIHGFDINSLTKLETKDTTAGKGNGKESGHPGRKGGAEDNWLTVEVEVKQVSCD